MLLEQLISFEASNIDAGFQVIYVAKLAVLRGLFIIVTLHAGIQAYGKKIALKIVRIALVECLAIGRFVVNFVARSAAAIGVCEAHALRI